MLSTFRWKHFLLHYQCSLCSVILGVTGHCRGGGGGVTLGVIGHYAVRYAHLKSQRRNVVNISTEVLFKITQEECCQYFNGSVVFYILWVGWVGMHI